MKKSGVFLLLALGLMFAARTTILADAQEAPTPPSELSNLSLRGFNLAAFTHDGFGPGQPVDTALRFAADEGANLITLDWSVAFNDVGTAAYGGGYNCPPMADIQTVIAKARQMGFIVALKPHVSAGSGANRNSLNTDDRFLPSNFFPAWKAYLTQLGTFATKNDVNIICIGTEMETLDWRYRDLWVDLIAGVRQSFQGQITYDSQCFLRASAKDINEVVFWDKVDFISWSLYVPLSKNDNASVGELRAAFTNNPIGDIRNVIEYLRGISERYGKQVMGLEGGYPSVSGGLLDPGGDNPSPAKNANWDLQDHGLKAYLSMLYENQGSWLKGLCLWVLQPEVMSPSWLDRYQYTQSWSVYRKPAADVVKEYYTLGGQQ
jgi:hypothetical protein